MGYEVTYKFHEKLLDGSYNYEESKTFKKKVGDPFDEISLEQLAAAIMAQLARRDIWIIDVEAFELSKKLINFKETKGGIVLKNKKFLFESTCSISSCSDEEEDEVAKPTISGNTGKHPHEFQQKSNSNVNQANLSSRRPIDQCIFLPELNQIPAIKQKNFKLTVEKQYSIYERKIGVGGEFYLIIDDSGKNQLVPSEYFVPAKITLVGDKEVNFSTTSSPKESGNLFWGGAVMDSNMPDIRERK